MVRIATPGDRFKASGGLVSAHTRGRALPPCGSAYGDESVFAAIREVVMMGTCETGGRRVGGPECVCVGDRLSQRGRGWKEGNDGKTWNEPSRPLDTCTNPARPREWRLGDHVYCEKIQPAFIPLLFSLRQQGELDQLPIPKTASHRRSAYRTLLPAFLPVVIGGHWRTVGDARR